MATSTTDLQATGATEAQQDERGPDHAHELGVRRPHLMMVGTFLAIAAATMLIGALLAGWLAARAAALGAGSPWLREGVEIPNLAVAVTYLTLLMSSFTAQWAVYAARTDDRKNLYVALGITLVLGAAFVNGLSFVFDQLGLEAGMTDVATHTYAVTVTHLLLVLAAMALFVVMGFRALTGQVSARRPELVASAAAFWHFTVLAGAAVYLVVFFFEGAPA
jgi:cytochrome c oxidase subunit 3